MNALDRLKDCTPDERRDLDLVAELLEAGRARERAVDTRTDRETDTPRDPAAEPRHDDPSADERAFAQGVRERIRRAEAGGARPEIARPLPGYLRAAAALLPPVALPKHVVAATGAGAAAKTGLKVLPAALAFPIVTLVMLVVTAVAMLRAVSRLAGAKPPSGPAVDPEVSAWWAQHGGAQAGATLLVLVGFLIAPVEGTVLALLLSGLMLVFLWGGLARYGLVSRHDIGFRTGMALFMLSIQLSMFAFVLSREQHGIDAAAVVLAAGAIACLWMGRKGHEGMVPIVVFAALLVVQQAVVPWTLGARTGRVATKQDEARRAVEELWITEPPVGFVDLQRIERAVAHLRAVDPARTLDLDRLRAAVQRHRDRPEVAGARFDHAASSVVRLGFDRPGDWERWARPRRERNLGKARFGGRLDRVAIRRVARAGLPDDRRQELAQWIVAGIGRAQLEDLLEIGWLLDDLDAPPEARERFASRVREKLRTDYVETMDRRQAGFMGFETEGLLPATADAPRRIDRLTFVTLGATSAAVALMARHGIPEGVDLVRLARYFDEQRMRPRRVEGPDACEVEAAAAWAHLTSLPAWGEQVERVPPTPWLQALVSWRILLASLVVSAFAVFATWRAPASAPPAS